MLVLQLLSIRCLLILRLVSKTTKAWVEFCRPSLLTSLSISFPPYSIPIESHRALHELAQNVWQLKITILASVASGEPPPPPPSLNSLALPSLPSLTKLKIVARTDDQFEPLIAFRRILQALDLPILDSLVIEDISIQGIVAMRWGPFCSISSEGSRDASMWQRITNLSLTVTPWWKAPKASQDGAETSNNTPHAHLNTEEKAGFKILHDWLSSFSSNTLERLRFAWVGLDEGPNPLLLDQFAAKSGRSKPWLSAPGIRWRHLTEVRFNGVEILDEQIQEIEKRATGLKRLLVETAWTEAEVEQGLAPADKEEWVEDVLNIDEANDDENVDLTDFLEPFSLASIYGKVPMMGKLTSIEKKTVNEEANEYDRIAGSLSHVGSFVTDWSNTSTYPDPFTS
ncbi:MAG: hypothetical protein Q9191_003627 [Dirinaria sp. TL-2023a]